VSGLPTPRANPELLGQDEAQEVLLRAARGGQLPHAWLLAGPPGIGKATLAYRFARFLFAGPDDGQGGGDGGGHGSGAAPEEAGLFGAPPPRPEPPLEAPASLFVSPEHAAFCRVAAGAEPDLVVLERQINESTGKRRGEIRVDEVRKACQFLRMTAAGGGWRIVLVDAADELNPNAANALLKVLEEPPRKALLLLVSHAPGRLLPTIRSRCCRLPLRPLSEARVTALLAQARPDLPAAEAAALARLADGSIGRALDLSDSGGLELYRELLGLLGGLAGPDLGAVRGRLDVARLHAFADRLARAGKEAAFGTAASFLIWWLARLVRAGSLGRLPEEVVAGEGALMTGLLNRAGLAQWLALWEKVSRLLGGVESANLDRKQALLASFLEVEALARPD
jgi:DNA polymerase-3 subunit delta'